MSTPTPAATDSPNNNGSNNNRNNNNNNNNNTNNNGNSNTLDTFMGTNVYLYGFLSTLILIFLVSVAVAYKGYRTRALLRQRIDEALAAGVFIPGVSSDDGPGGRRRRGDGAEKPILSEVWLRRRPAANLGKWVQLQVCPTPNPSLQCSLLVARGSSFIVVSHSASSLSLVYRPPANHRHR